jgi:muconate cycloisomerase
MAIESVEVVPYALRFREPYVTARGALERREIVLLRIRSDDGIEGLGEAVPLSLRGGASLEQVAGELRECEGETTAEMSPPARAAVEAARLDLRGKLENAPAWSLLGAESASAVRCNATLTAGDPAAVAAQAERWAGLGFETFKLKVGMPGDVSQAEAVRTAAGPEARIRLDANGAWRPAEAVTKLAAVERLGIELAEEPVSGLEELALVRGQTAIPIAADESVADVAQAQRAVELGACALATVKLSKVGGFDAALAIAAELPVYLSSALDGPVGIAAAGHLAQALGAGDAGVAHGLATQLLFEDTIAAVGPEIREGFLHLPEGPGLGVEIDEEALERLRI